MVIVEWAFWLSSVAVVYPYFIYPLILAIWNRVVSEQKDAVAANQGGWIKPGSHLPSVTLIVSAYNEEVVIARKIENALALDYPVQALEIIVVSDGCTDGTEEIVDRYAESDDRVRLLRLDKQSGKSAGLNQAVPLAIGEIIVFSDANAIYEKDSLRELVAPFSDPDVGYTVGSALYRDEDAEAVNVSEGIYWKYELWIKRLESDFHSVVGGDGAIYAIRRELYQPLATVDISDFVNPMQIVAAGYRGVFLPSARSYEGGTSQFSDEFRRKRRIVNRSWSAVRRHISLFSPWQHRRFLFMLLSHKVIRWWSVAFVVVATIAGSMLSVGPSPRLYPWLVAGIGGSIFLALVGWRMDKAGYSMPKLIYLPYYFYLVGLASLFGIFDDFRGRSYATWSHVR